MKRLAEDPHEIPPAFAQLQLNEKDLHKHVLVEVLPFHLESYLGKGIIDYSQLTTLIVYFNPEAGLMKPQFYMEAKQQEKEALLQ
jgi:anaerobic magnesium-protoporphyrin IX monomethyl ester cyclase